MWWHSRLNCHLWHLCPIWGYRLKAQLLFFLAIFLLIQTQEDSKSWPKCVSSPYEKTGLEVRGDGFTLEWSWPRPGFGRHSESEAADEGFVSSTLSFTQTITGVNKLFLEKNVQPRSLPLKTNFLTTNNRLRERKFLLKIYKSTGYRITPKKASGLQETFWPNYLKFCKYSVSYKLSKWRVALYGVLTEVILIHLKLNIILICSLKQSLLKTFLVSPFSVSN